MRMILRLFLLAVIAIAGTDEGADTALVVTDQGFPYDFAGPEDCR